MYFLNPSNTFCFGSKDDYLELPWAWATVKAQTKTGVILFHKVYAFCRLACSQFPLLSIPDAIGIDIEDKEVMHRVVGLFSQMHCQIRPHRKPISTTRLVKRALECFTLMGYKYDTTRKGFLLTNCIALYRNPDLIGHRFVRDLMQNAVLRALDIVNVAKQCVIRANTVDLEHVPETAPSETSTSHGECASVTDAPCSEEEPVTDMESFWSQFIDDVPLSMVPVQVDCAALLSTARMLPDSAFLSLSDHFSLKLIKEVASVIFK